MVDRKKVNKLSTLAKRFSQTPKLCKKEILNHVKICINLKDV